MEKCVGRDCSFGVTSCLVPSGHFSRTQKKAERRQNRLPYSKRPESTRKPTLGQSMLVLKPNLLILAPGVTLGPHVSFQWQEYSLLPTSWPALATTSLALRIFAGKNQNCLQTTLSFLLKSWHFGGFALGYTISERSIYKRNLRN